MAEQEFNIGDKVYHISLSSVIWVVEKIENDLAYCSTLVKETLELKKEKFTLSSIKKVADRQPTALVRRKSNYY